MADIKPVDYIQYVKIADPDQGEEYYGFKAEGSGGGGGGTGSSGGYFTTTLSKNDWVKVGTLNAYVQVKKFSSIVSVPADKKPTEEDVCVIDYKGNNSIESITTTSAEWSKIYYVTTNFEVSDGSQIEFYATEPLTIDVAVVGKW